MISIMDGCKESNNTKEHQGSGSALNSSFDGVHSFLAGLNRIGDGGLWDDLWSWLGKWGLVNWVDLDVCWLNWHVNDRLTLWSHLRISFFTRTLRINLIVLLVHFS